MIRSIEDIAAEEEARIRAVRNVWFLKVFLAASILTLVAGWILLAKGETASGCLLMTVSLTALLFRAGSLRNLFPSAAALFGGLAAGIGTFLLYRWTAVSSFGWGRDPSFWLASLYGQVPEPAWSPLSYLGVGALTCFLAPEKLAHHLPAISALTAAAAVTLAVVSFLRGSRNDPGRNLALLLGVPVLILNRPFWMAGTIASGIPAFLGLSLFLVFLASLPREGNPGASSRAFLLGLLASVHPFWGLLGFLSMFLERRVSDARSLRSWGWLAAGLTPYLWVLHQADRVYPSWGGADPFGEAFRSLGATLGGRWNSDWSLVSALESWGSALGWMAAFTILGVLLAPRGRGLLARGFHPLTGIAAMAAGILFASRETGILTAVALWVPVVLVYAWIPSGAEPTAKGTPSSASPVRTGLRLLVLAGATVLALVDDPVVSRTGEGELPRRHAMNLLTGGDSRTAVFFEDGFESDACRLLQRTEGAASKALLIDRPLLSRRWFLAGLIRHHPEWLFSTGVGSSDTLFQDMLERNMGTWTVRWAVSEVPFRWEGLLASGGWKAMPQVLHQRLVKPGPGEPPFEDLSVRYDLSGWIPPVSDPGRAFVKVRSRYTRGFFDLGRRMEELGKYSLSIRSYERAIKMDPGFPAPREALTRLFTEKNVLQAARMDFESVLRGHPARIRFWIEAASEYGMDGKDPRILEALDEMIRLNMELSDAQYHLGLIYEKEGDALKARELLESASRLAPQRVEIQMELGRQLLKAGNRLKAAESFRAVLNIDPENREAQKQLWNLLNRP